MVNKNETTDAAIEAFADRLRAALERQFQDAPDWVLETHPVVTDGAVLTGWLAVIRNDAATPKIRRAYNLRVEDAAPYLRNPTTLAEALAYVPRRMVAAQEAGR